MTDDDGALDALRHLCKCGQPRLLLHYLYFSRQQDAANAAAELRGYGFPTEERLGADGVNWLVLAQHQVLPSEETIAIASQLMEDLTQKHRGEYDGWEADVA